MKDWLLAEVRILRIHQFLSIIQKFVQICALFVCLWPFGRYDNHAAIIATNGNISVKHTRAELVNAKLKERRKGVPSERLAATRKRYRETKFRLGRSDHCNVYTHHTLCMLNGFSRQWPSADCTTQHKPLCLILSVNDTSIDGRCLTSSV